MKKLSVLIFALACLLHTVGCGENPQYTEVNEPGGPGTTEEETVSFRAEVLEVHDRYVLVQPHAGSYESKSADRIEVPLAEKTSWPVPAVGDTVSIFYSGGILETYPARITKVHRVEIEVGTADITPDSEIPGARTHLVEIWDRAKEENLECAEAVEKFYEDETADYYFSCIKSHYVIAMDSTGRTVDIVTALQEGLATIEDLDAYGIEYFTEPKEDALDVAVSGAILDHYRSDKPDGLIRMESHVILGRETLSGTPRVGENGHVEMTVVYLLAYHGKYSVYGGKPEMIDSSCTPAAIMFRNDSGAYIPEEYWEPEAGDRREEDVRSKFPNSAADNALNHQAYIEELREQNYQKMLAYLDGMGSLEARIAGLLEEIMSSPLHASDPGAYLKAHEAAYRELLGYGEYTLRYCFAAFLQGGRTGLDGHIMAAACRDIMLAWGEAYIMDVAPMTGQGWFEEFCGNAESLSKQYNREELGQNFPGALLLLRMREQGKNTQ